MKRVVKLLILGASALVLATCNEGPTAGEIAFDLTSANADDGAIQFTASAVAPDSVTGATPACTGCQVFLARVSATELRGVVTGNIGAGALVNLGVTDVGKPESYSMTVVAAASRTYKVQAGAYSLKSEK